MSEHDKEQVFHLPSYGVLCGTLTDFKKEIPMISEMV
jgi:hypothetical protein